MVEFLITKLSGSYIIKLENNCFLKVVFSMVIETFYFPATLIA